MDRFNVFYPSSGVRYDLAEDGKTEINHRYTLMTAGCGCCSDPEELTQENLNELKADLEKALQWVYDRLRGV